MLDRWHVVCLAVVCLACVGLVAGASGGVVAQSTNNTTNETVQHERPESVGESGDLQRLEQWLEGRMSDQLESSSIALSQGQYERANEVLGNDYDSRLSQYVDVAGETGEGGETGETYREVKENQQELATKAQRFEAAEERYVEARENGNTAAARAAARQMNRLASQVADSGGNLTREYGALANQTGTETDEEQAIVENVTENITDRNAEVRAETLVETTVTVVDATRSISFADPLRVTGRIETANGTALSNQTVKIDVKGTNRSVTTDGDGQFAVSYRPRTLALNASSVRLAYVPQIDSVYLGSNTSIPVAVEQVTPTLTIRNATETGRYGQQAGANVVVTVDGEPVDGIPIAGRIGDASLGQNTTDDTGSTRVESELPATVLSGDQEVLVAVPLENRAIGPAEETAAVQVASTATNLSVTAQKRNGELNISGRLQTADGQPVGRQTVRITRNDTAVATVQTGPNGTFTATIGRGSAAGSTMQVGARYDGTGTNLESSRAMITLSVGAHDTNPLSGHESDTNPWPFVAAGVVLVLGAGGFLAWRRRTTDADASLTAEPTAAATESATPADHKRNNRDPTALDRAERFLDSGATGAAVRSAYAGVRDWCLDAEFSGTHWELLEQAPSLSSDERAALEQIVRAYERAAFSPTAVDVDDASDTIAAARMLLHRGDVDTQQDD